NATRYRSANGPRRNETGPTSPVTSHRRETPRSRSPASHDDTEDASGPSSWPKSSEPTYRNDQWFTSTDGGSASAGPASQALPNPARQITCASSPFIGKPRPQPSVATRWTPSSVGSGSG